MGRRREDEKCEEKVESGVREVDGEWGGGMEKKFTTKLVLN